MRLPTQQKLPIARLEAGQRLLDIRAGVALKRQPPLAIYAAVNGISPKNERGSQKQQSNGVFHRAFKVSNAGAAVGAPASLRRNVFFSLILCGLLLCAGCADQSTQYAGIWKSRCDDYWGVQIKPGVGGRYEVTFCGLSGCLAPGEWLPDTAIVDDPTYEVISGSQIRIRHGERPPMLYTRCSRKTDWTTNVLDLR